MLKSIRAHKRSIAAMIFALLISVSMLFFGNDFGGPSTERAAIKIGDREISYSDFTQRRRELEGRYRQMFGEQYYQIVDSMGVNLSQQTVDQTIADVLIESAAGAIGLEAGTEELKQSIKKNVFGGQSIDRQTFQAILRELEMTSQQFSERMSGDVRRTQYLDLFRHASEASAAEARAMIARDKTEYGVHFVSFGAQEHLAAVADPDPQTLQVLYEEEATELELPERVAYEYLLFSPKDFAKQVEVSADDVEFYYSEHQAEFTTPDQARVRQITIYFPKEDAPELLAQTKERAEEALGKAVAGEPFETLVAQYSEDHLTKALGGDLGMLTKGKMSKEFDAAVFALNGPGIAELISTDTGYQIAKIEEYLPAAPKPLAEVETQIREKLQESEAPAYARNAADELLAQIGQRSLAELATDKQLTVKSSAGLQRAGADPADADAVGLTRAILSAGIRDHGIVDLERLSVLVVVTEYREPEVPPLSEVRAKLIEIWRNREAKKLARAAAEALLAEIREEKFPSLEAAAKAKKLTIGDEQGLTRVKSPKPPLNASAIRKAIFSVHKAGAAPQGVFEADGSFVVAQVQSIKETAAQDDQKAVTQSERRLSGQLAQASIESVIAELKGKTEIDIDPGLLIE